MVLVWRNIDDSPNLPNFLPAKLSCYTVYYTPLHNHLKNGFMYACTYMSNLEGRLYTLDNKVVDQNYFATTNSRNYYLGLPGWCLCINCAASLTSSSTVTNNDNEPDEVIITQLKNAEMVCSKPMTCQTILRLSLTILEPMYKACPSEECSESPAIAIGSKKP